MSTSFAKYLSVAEAARQMGVSRQYLYRLISEGRVKAKTIAGKKVIHVGQLRR